MIDNLQISSPSTGTLRIQGDADADRIEYLIQDAPGSTPSSDAEPTGQTEVSRGEAFSVDVTGLSPGQRRVFVRGVDTQAKIYTVATQSGTLPTGTHTQLSTRDAIRVWVNETPVAEPFFYLYVRHGSSTIKMRMHRFESRLLRIQPGESFGFATEDGREIQFSYDNSPVSLAPSFTVSGTAACDKAGPPLWEPTAPHIALGSGKSFQIESDGTDRILFVAEFDGETWSPPRWLRLPVAGGVRYHATFKQIAIANYDGSPVGISAPEGSVIGGESAAMHLELPEVTGTTHSVSDVVELKAAIAAAVAGDEIVLADGAYSLDVDISESSFLANHNVSGRKGMEGIVIRSESGDREACVISCSSSLTGTWNIAQSGATLRSCVSGITFDFSDNSTAAFTINRGVWSLENCRWTNSGADGMNFIGPIFVDFLRCECSSNGGDGFNGNWTPEDAQYRIRVIDCETFEQGTNQSHQGLTSHNGLNLEAYGGKYHDAQTNVIAPDGLTDIFLFFVNTYRTTRNCGILGCHTFGCSLAMSQTSTSALGIKSNGYAIANIFGNGIRESEDTSRVVHGNYFLSNNDTNTSAYYPTIESSTEFQFNICETWSRGLRFDYSSADGLAQGHYNTFVNGNLAIFAASSSFDKVIRGNVSKNMTTGINTNTDAAAKLTSSHNVLGNQNASNAFVPDATDIFGVDAELDSLLFPTEDGNCDGNGDPEFTDWVGGTDYCGYPLRLASAVMDRGARCRPRIVENSELLPDLW